MSRELIEEIRNAHTAHERARVQAVLDARVVRGDGPTLTRKGTELDYSVGAASSPSWCGHGVWCGCGCPVCEDEARERSEG